MSLPLLDLAAFASAFGAAERAGLLGAIGAAPDDAAGLARRLGLDPNATELVLEVLRTWGIATYDGGRYRASALLDAERNRDLLLSIFAHTPELLRTGVPFFPQTDTAAGRAAVYAGVVPSLGERAEGLGLADRVTLLPGDLHEASLEPRRFDRIILANVLHLEPAHAAEAILARLAPALRPGGRFVLVDAMATPTPEIDRSHHAYALFLALRVPRSRAHPESDLRAWLAAAGAPAARRIDLSGPPLGLSALVSEP